MRLIRIAVASVDPTVGAVRSNIDRMRAMAREMGEAGVTLGCFSEQVVGGYRAPRALPPALGSGRDRPEPGHRRALQLRVVQRNEWS